MYSLHHIDTCLPDYFRGHHLPVVQVVVYQETTFATIRQMLLDTYDSIDHLPEIDIQKYKEAVEELFSSLSSEQMNTVPTCFLGIESMEDDDCTDSVYAFFVIQTIGEEDE